MLWECLGCRDTYFFSSSFPEKTCKSKLTNRCKVLGEAPHQPPYDDLEGVSALTSLPDKAWHREIDKLVLSAGSASVKTAIVCPPTIYGPGRGPDNTRSRQVYGLAKMTLEKGQAPILGKGLTEWDNVQ